GVLSPVGHDLFLDVRRFEGRVQVEDAARADVEVTMDAAAVTVRCARRGEEELRDALSASDLADIGRRLQAEVLRAARHPRIVFRAERVSSGAGPRGLLLPGTLTLAGRPAAVLVELEQPEAAEPRFLLRCRMRQTAFGIEPYRALLGALRVRDEVLLRGALVLEPAPS
ncbi:MAG TPA: YceI family protein, partial [Myxococcota bacterium]|nr:YceI family protein [Myxococcota bacterium]